MCIIERIREIVEWKMNRKIIRRNFEGNTEKSPVAAAHGCVGYLPLYPSTAINNCAVCTITLSEQDASLKQEYVSGVCRKANASQCSGKRETTASRLTG